MDSEKLSVNSRQLSVDNERVATAVRDACVQAALAAYEDAAMSGLCHEGAWECAVDAMRSLKVERLIAEWQQKEARDG